jgi:hypothetical protein
VISNRFIPSVLATAVLVGSVGFVASSPVKAQSTSQATQAAKLAATKLTLTPNQRQYLRGGTVQVTGRFSPNESVEIFQIFTHERTQKDVLESVTTLRADARGVVKFNYRIPGDPLKDNLRVFMEGAQRSPNVRIPLSAPPSVTPPKVPGQVANNPTQMFPKVALSGIAKVKSKSYMETEVKISQTPTGGLLTAKTVTWTTDKFQGFTGGVEVFLLDQKDNVIYVSDLHEYGVNGKWIPGAPDSRTDSWKETLSPEILSRVSRVAFVHRHTPKNRFSKFIKNLKELASAVKAVGDAVGSVASLGAGKAP